jgi:hypothetical protein
MKKTVKNKTGDINGGALEKLLQTYIMLNPLMVRHVRIELTSSGFRVRRPSNEHMTQT